MTDLPHFAQEPIGGEQLAFLAKLFAAITIGAEHEAEFIVAAMSPEQREQFTVTLTDAWESQVWLYRRAAALVGNVILTEPKMEG